MKKEKMLFHKTIFSMVMMIVLFFVSSMAFGNHSYAEEDKSLTDKNTRIVLGDIEGNSVDMSLEEYEEFSKAEITPKSTIKEIKKSVENYRKQQTLIGPKLLSERATYNWAFGDWSNWQDDGAISFDLRGQFPTSLGGTRYDWKAEADFKISRIGDTHPYIQMDFNGFEVSNITNSTLTTNKASGDTSHVYKDNLRQTKINLNGNFNTLHRPGSPPIFYLSYTSDFAPAIYYPDNAGSVTVSNWIQYNSTDPNGYRANEQNRIKFWYNYVPVVPQIVKSVHKDLNTSADLGHKGEVGRGGYYGNDVSLSKVDISGYTFDHQQYVDENGTSIDSSNTTWKGTLNETKRGVIWWYMKNATNLSLSKSNDKSSSGAKIGDTVSYTVSAKNGGSSKLYNLRIEDTLPNGMDKPSNVGITVNGGGAMSIKEGQSNANSSGEYYTWDASSRKLTVYINAAESNETKGISYTSKVLSGNSGDTKTNTAKLYAKNDGGNNPTANSSFKIKGETQLSIEKTNDKSTSGAKVGDTVSYTVKPKNSGNLVLETPFIEDTLPEGMEKPTNIRANTSSDLKEGEANKNSFGEYYTWDQNSRKLKVYFSQTNGLGPNVTATIYYKSKVLSGNDGDTKTNAVSLAGVNDNGKHPKAQSSFKIKGETKLGITKTNNKSSTGAKVGDVVTYTVVGTNDGNLKLDNPSFTDVLPTGLGEPTNVKAVGTYESAILKKGKENANSNGEYYTWDSSTRKLTVYTTEIGPGTKKTIAYDSKINEGYDGETKKNTVTLAGINDNGVHPSTDSTFKIIGEPKINLSKTASSTTAKVGDTIHYSVSLGKNTGNATLKSPIIKDVLPEGMEKPSNVVINSNGTRVSIKEGKSNANGQGEYYTWDEDSRTLTAYINLVNINGSKGIEYDTKVITGNDGEKKINKASASASNTENKPTAQATVTIEDKKIKLHIKQEVINKNSQVVVPSSGGGNLKQVSTGTVSDVQGSYGVIFPSYEADTNKAFETILLKWTDDYQGYILDNLVPEFYGYEGYVLTTSEEKHDSNNRIKDNPPVMDYSLNDEYWLTIYITPKVSEDGPPFYNWDYKVNEFGKIKF